MKLDNPTDDELNAAFADMVAGWAFHPTLKIWHDNFDRTVDAPRFTTSADAVLPWLEKCPYWSVDGGVNKTWMVIAGDAQAEAQSFLRAAVIALLRAHGVEVEFTQ